MSTVTTEHVTSTGPRGNGQNVIVTDERVRSNVIGLIALGLAIVGFIFAALLLTAGIAWMLLLPALILGAVGLFLPNRRKGAALAAVIIALMGLILSFVGFRLPLGAGDGSVLGSGVVNNSGVNPFSVLTGGGGNTQLGETGGTATGPGTGTGGTGVQVGVESVDCHTPLATVTGLNLTGELCVVSVAVTNNGTEVIDINSGNVTAVSGGTGYTADATLGDGDSNLLDAHLEVGESTTGTVYVNLPSGTTDLDSLSVSLGDNPAADVLVDLGN